MTVVEERQPSLFPGGPGSAELVSRCLGTDLLGVPLGRLWGVRLPSGLVHWFDSEDEARGSRFWT